MSNPWLSIPLEDYERHMSLPAVGQAQMIADQFDRALARTAPASVAVIGCAGVTDSIESEAARSPRSWP